MTAPRSPVPLAATPAASGTGQDPACTTAGALDGAPVLSQGGPGAGTPIPAPGTRASAARVEGEASRAAEFHPRTWTLTLPAGMQLLNANDRDAHWGRRKKLTDSLRQTAAWLARQQRIPLLDRAHVLALYEPPDMRRRDPANYYPSVKACVDGIVQDAGVLADDDAAHLDGPDMRLGEPYPGGRLVLTITEVTG